MDTKLTQTSTPWLLLFSRLALFAGIQALLALGFLLAGSPAPWQAAANWWPLGVTLANLLCLALLVRAFRAESGRFRDLFRARKDTFLADLLILLGLFLIGGPLGYFPNPLLSKALFGDSQLVLPLLIRPLPYWAVYLSLVLFPLTQGLAELPTYFGYVMPRLEAKGLRPWLAVTLPALVLSLQHIAIPLLFDLRFMLWRGLMFLPFAFFAGIVLHWRPRLLPFMAAMHVLMDLSFAMMLLSAAY